MPIERDAGAGVSAQPSRPGYSEEWYTPAEFINAVREVLGGIDLDPASCELANRVVDADRFFNAAEDGLQQDWAGRVFVNPLYGNTSAFIEKLLRHHTAGEVTAAIVLLDTQAAHAEYFQPLWDFVLCFTRGSIVFRRPDETRESRPPTGSVFVYLGPDRDRFASVFGGLGNVVVRVADESTDGRLCPEPPAPRNPDRARRTGRPR